MAEVFATVASGAGVASLAIQNTESALKLKDLWSSLKDAPSDLSSAIDELVVLANLLDSIRRHNTITATDNRPDSSWTGCFELCERAADKLKNILDDLQGEMQKSRRLGSIKVMLKKVVIAKAKEMLASAKSLLISAQLQYSLSGVRTFLRGP